MTKPEVIIGDIPNSMVVPLFEAIITRAQYNGSAPLVFEIPYKGNCEHTKNTNNATVVYKTFSLKGIFLSACFTSGRNGRNGLTKFSNRKLEDIFMCARVSILLGRRKK